PIRRPTPRARGSAEWGRAPARDGTLAGDRTLAAGTRAGDSLAGERTPAGDSLAGDRAPAGDRHRHGDDRPARWDPPPRVDYTTVRRLHRAVADELAETLRSAPPTTDAGTLGEQIATRHVKSYVDNERLRGHLVTDADEAALRDAVVGELAGLGRLRLLLADPRVENVHVLGHDRVRI